MEKGIITLLTFSKFHFSFNLGLIWGVNSKELKRPIKNHYQNWFEQNVKLEINVEMVSNCELWQENKSLLQSPSGLDENFFQREGNPIMTCEIEAW